MEDGTLGDGRDLLVSVPVLYQNRCNAAYLDGLTKQNLWRFFSLQLIQGTVSEVVFRKREMRKTSVLRKPKQTVYRGGSTVEILAREGYDVVTHL